MEYFLREEGDLAFVIRFEVKEAVALDSGSSNAPYRLHGGHGVVSGGMSIVSEKVVTGRNEKVTDTDVHARRWKGRAKVARFSKRDEHYEVD